MRTSTTVHRHWPCCAFSRRGSLARPCRFGAMRTRPSWRTTSSGLSRTCGPTRRRSPRWPRTPRRRFLAARRALIPPLPRMARRRLRATRRSAESVPRRAQRLRGRLELTDDGDDTAFDGGETDGGRTLASRRRHGRLDPSDNEDDHDAAPASFERFFKLSATLPPTARTPEPQICNEKENLRGSGGTPQARCRRHTAPRMCNE